MRLFDKMTGKFKFDEIKIFDSSGNCVYQGDFINLPYDNNLIIEKSILYFDDPQPCFIHRSAVINRLCLELEEFLRQYTQNASMDLLIKDLPSDIKAIIPFRDKAEKLFLQWV